MTDEGRYNEGRGRFAEGGVGWGSNGSRSTRDTVVQRGVLNLEHLTQILTLFIYLFINIYTINMNTPRVVEC